MKMASLPMPLKYTCPTDAQNSNIHTSWAAQNALNMAVAIVTFAYDIPPKPS